MELREVRENPSGRDVCSSGGPKEPGPPPLEVTPLVEVKVDYTSTKVSLGLTSRQRIVRLEWTTLYWFTYSSSLSKRVMFASLFFKHSSTRLVVER